ncbi:adenine phosphoribosyl transferase 3 [Actinidia rufa]|uniref:adenine phosphoribosyltransferase n=1 Tax=Actinidia rufa TaxID=165716 RepID=A0A7J0H0F3_9ERIC|nr:adenine phosphoribosyl transferase 3 [Actinidia rufa]
MFQDITTLLLDPKAFKDTIDLFIERFKGKNISVVAGIEARGFIFGPPIALAIGAKFVPLRKPRKLPGEVISEKYVLEYGTDCLEMHVGAVEPDERALVVDDLIATGGTLCAAMNLLERAGAEVVECACVIELPDLKLLGLSISRCMIWLFIEVIGPILYLSHYQWYQSQHGPMEGTVAVWLEE